MPSPQDSLLCSAGREKDIGVEQEAEIQFLSRIVRKQTPDRQEDPAEFLLNIARLKICLNTAAKLLENDAVQGGFHICMNPVRWNCGD